MNQNISTLKRNINYHTSTISQELFRTFESKVYYKIGVEIQPQLYEILALLRSLIIFFVKKYACVKRNPDRKPICATDKFLFKDKSYFLLIFLSTLPNDTQIYKISRQLHCN